MANEEIKEEDYADNIPWDKDETSATYTSAVKTTLGHITVFKIGNAYEAITLVERGKVHLLFKEISFSKQSIDCVMEIILDVKDATYPKFSQRVDLRSASARKSLATDLNSAYGNKTSGYNWVLILNGAFNNVAEEIYKEQKPVSVEHDVYEDIPFLAHPFLQKNVSNLLFAQSEAGKTWLALFMALRLVSGGTFLSYPLTGGKKTLFLDYEDDMRTFINRLYKLCAGAGVFYKDIAPHIHYYKPTGSFRNNVELIKDMVLKGSFDLIIIDAGGDATGGSPSDEEKVLDLFNALEEVHCTKLILHHEPKNVINESNAFYGSTYWKARSRVAWRLEVENEDGSEKTIKATIQKRSNLPYVEPIYYKTYFDFVDMDAMFGGNSQPLTNSVRFEVTSASAPTSQFSLEDQLLSELQKGEATETQLAQLVGKDRSYVNKRLNNLKFRGILDQVRAGKSIVWKLKN